MGDRPVWRLWLGISILLMSAMMMPTLGMRTNSTHAAVIDTPTPSPPSGLPPGPVAPTPSANSPTGVTGVAPPQLSVRPAFIPSNGSIPAVVTATMTAQPPGTVTFSSTGPTYFENGSNIETVPCGNDGASCIGAAVFVVGNGTVGDAPISVFYQSASGVYTAASSTVLVVAPSGKPFITLGCFPPIVVAGDSGSLCGAEITDANGVRLTGISNAGITYSLSDPMVADVFLCQLHAGPRPATTVVESCPAETNQTPSVSFLVEGQSIAKVVRAPLARPGPVTLSATLTTVAPSGFPCYLANIRMLTGCGLDNIVVPGTTFIAPNSTTATTTLTIADTDSIATSPGAEPSLTNGGTESIQIVAATAPQPLALPRGCNQIVVRITAGTPIAKIAALVSPPSAVASIWLFDNSVKRFGANYFSDPGAPIDFNTAGGMPAGQQRSSSVNQGGSLTNVFYVCVTRATTIATS